MIIDVNRTDRTPYRYFNVVKLIGNYNEKGEFYFALVKKGDSALSPKTALRPEEISSITATPEDYERVPEYLTDTGASVLAGAKELDRLILVLSRLMLNG